METYLLKLKLGLLTIPLYKTNDVWKQTSYNNNFRQVYAGSGYTYDSSIDKFIPQKPHDNWVWDETNWRWKTPVDVPTEPGPWRWNQEENTWENKRGI